MTQEQKAKAYDEALEKARKLYNDAKANEYKSDMEDYESIFPELAESEDERIRKVIVKYFKELHVESWINLEIPDILAWLEKHSEEEIRKIHKEEYTNGFNDAAGFGKQKEQKPIEMEVYEVGKGTTICGQDYKCKKDYQVGNCKYIKDAIYHCGRDGYLTDQNGVSWSCTPEWFNEYIQSNTEWAEEEKTRFVSGQFLQCKLSFDGFKEGEHYWLEYIGDDMYVGRSDNILNQKFHITPRQLYTLFSQKLEEVQGPPQEEKQISLNYEPPFNENPSDIEIIDALIKHLKEQDGFLTAIDCVSTKAILSWLEKQKEQSEEPKIVFGDWGDKEKREAIITCLKYMRFVKKITNQEYDDLIKWLDNNYVKVEQKPAEWSEEDEKDMAHIIRILDDCYVYGTHDLSKTDRENLVNKLKSLRPSWKPNEEQMKALLNTLHPDDPYYPVLKSLYEQLK